MRLLYDKAEKFKYLTHAISRLHDEVYLEVSRDSVRFWVMSPDKTAMAFVRLPSHAFSEFEVESEVTMAISSEELDRIARRAIRGDALLLESKGELLEAALLNRDKGIERRFSLSSSLREERFKDIRLKPEVEFVMSSEDFGLLLGDIKLVSDSVTFKAENEEVRVIARGEEKEYTWILRRGDPLLDLRVEGPAEASYSRSSLEIASRPASAAEEIRLAYATERPLRMSFAIAGEEVMVIYVAPLAE